MWDPGGDYMATATTLTRNLGLRLSPQLTADALYNLNKIDDLGSVYNVDTTGSVVIRSRGAISLLPNSPDVGGPGVGGTLSLGDPSQLLDSLNIHASTVSTAGSISLLDQATSGNKYLHILYKTDLDGSVDTVSDRSLLVDLNGANRNLVLGGNLSVLGSNLSLTLTAPLSLTLPPDVGSAGQLLTTDGSGGLHWSTVSGSGTVTSVGLSMPAEFSVSSSPVTAAGVLTVTKQTQTANLVYAGPSSGGAAQPSFRSLVAADISAAGAVTSYSTVWAAADGTSKTVTHNLGTTHVDVCLVDLADNTRILVDTTTVTSANITTLTASEAPSLSGWRVMVQANN